MKQIANKNARDYVQNLELFKGSNLFSETLGDYYVVLGQCTPYNVDLMELPTRELKDIIDAAERC